MLDYKGAFIDQMSEGCSVANYIDQIAARAAQQ